MILSILIIAIYAALHVVLFMFIAKDIRLIETNYSRAAGYGMRRMKIILLVLSLLLVPLTIAIGVFLTAAPIFDPGVSSVIAIVVLILACALTETILLNRGEEKHRVLPWALAAVNLISALLLWLTLLALLRFSNGLSDWLYSYYYTPPYDPWKMIDIVPFVALMITALQLVLMAKQLFYALRFRVGASVIPMHLAVIGANLISCGIAMVLPRVIPDPEVYANVSIAVLILLNLGAIAASIVIYLRDDYRIRFSKYPPQPKELRPGGVGAISDGQAISELPIGIDGGLDGVSGISGDMIVTTKK